MILLWGMSGDDPLTRVAAELRRRRTPFLVLDQRHVLNAESELDERSDSMWLSSPSGGFRLLATDCAYVRVYDARELPELMHADMETLARVDALESRLWTFIELLEGRVLNRPSAMASNNSKPYQLQLIQGHGFLAPETLVTTCPRAAQEFWERHGQVIYKSVSGVRSVVARLADADKHRMTDLTWCPTQLQAWVPGQDVRVHVVGERVFAAAIESDADDYRYASRQGRSAELRPMTLPHEIAERCYRTAHALSLPLAGLDLRRTPEGAWYCFEVNPSPCFTYYEDHTGQALSEAVAQYLAAAA